jgi:RNA polymerase sigma-70 factor, ECF subfamily
MARELDDPHNLTSAGVFEAYGDRIRTYIVSIVRDPSEAEDLTQETFLRAHRKLQSLQDPATLSTWLYRIATHVCYDRFRQPSYRRKAPLADAGGENETKDLDLEDENTPRLDTALERAEMNACIREYIENLSDSYRTVILLHDLHGMTNPEIAEKMGCSLATVKIRLHRARVRLKETLAGACDFSHDEQGVLGCERKPTEDP